MKKKRTIAILAAAAVMLTLLTGCADKEPEVAEPIEIIEYETVEVTMEPIVPTPLPEPETVAGICLANGLQVFYKYLNRGDEVSIIGEDGEYFLIEGGEDFRGDPAPLLVEKKYVRTDDEEIESRTVYCVGDAPIYSSAVCGDGQVVLNAAQNAEVTVVDEMNGILYVEWTEPGEGDESAVKHGYMKASDTSDSYINSYGWYGGGGSSEPSYGYDGGDIAAGDLLGVRVRTGGAAADFLAPARRFAIRAKLSETEKAEPTRGVCFSDEVPAYAGVLKYGEEVKVLTENGEEAETRMMFSYSTDEDGERSYEEVPVRDEGILLNGILCSVPECVIRMPEDEPYEPWDGFVQNKAVAYFTYDLSDDGTDIPVNTPVTVEDEILGVLIVRDGDEVYYFTPDSIGTEEYVAPVSYGWYGGGDGEVVDAWTPPAL